MPYHKPYIIPYHIPYHKAYYRPYHITHTIYTTQYIIYHTIPCAIYHIIPNTIYHIISYIIYHIIHHRPCTSHLVHTAHNSWALQSWVGASWPANWAILRREALTALEPSRFPQGRGQEIEEVGVGRMWVSLLHVTSLLKSQDYSKSKIPSSFSLLLLLVKHKKGVSLIRTLQMEWATRESWGSLPQEAISHQLGLVAARQVGAVEL